MKRMVDILAWLEVFFFWTFQQNYWVDCFLKLWLDFFGDFYLHFCFLMLYLAIWRGVVFQCPMVKVGWHKDVIKN